MYVIGFNISKIHPTQKLHLPTNKNFVRQETAWPIRGPKQVRINSQAMRKRLIFMPLSKILIKDIVQCDAVENGRQVYTRT